MKTNIELLAPAGNVEALHAAISAGADAVYLGLESFNARRGADNFTMESLAQACEYAHLRGASVYVAMNTVVLPAEVDEALECARQAYRAGADAFIVQDIGFASELVRTLPEARLHVSTQMNTHNAAGIRAAARLGATRVTLARELSLPEIDHLSQVAAEWGLEVEAFAHGALCVCYSGQCFMSSMIGGRSANRGMCAQACRLPYELKSASLHSKSLPSPGDHLLSPQDLCSIDLLEHLVRSGVASLKIEGRMKSAEYVASVVAVYRAVLDRVIEKVDGEGSQDVRATKEERDALSAAFSRGFTTAYLEGRRGNDIMSYQRPNNRGQFVGRVVGVRNDVAVISCERELMVGDVIEFWTKKGHVALTVASVEPRDGGNVAVPLDAKTRSVRASDRVFRVRSVEAAFSDDALSPRIPIVGRVTMHIGSPLHMEFSLAVPQGPVASPRGIGDIVGVRLAGKFSGVVGCAEGSIVEPARTKAVTAQDILAHVDRLGSTPFVLDRLDIDLDEGVGIGFSQVHRCRAEALDNLAAALLSGTQYRPLPRVVPNDAVFEDPREKCIVAAWATNPVCARAAKRAGADVIFIPALNYRRGEAAIAGQLMGNVDQAGYPKQCVPALPVVDHDPVGSSREAQVDFDPWRYVGAGKPVVVESLASLQRAVEEGAVPEIGPHLPLTNRFALTWAAQAGASRVWLSPELTLRQIEDLAKDAPVGLGLTVVGSQELMTTEHCLLMSQGPCDQQCSTCPRRKSPHFLKDRKGFEFPVMTDAFGRSHLYNSVQLDVVPAIPDLLAAGVSAFMVDTTLMNGEEAAQATGRVVRALKVAQLDGNTLAKMPDTTSGHLYRGVS